MDSEQIILRPGGLSVRSSTAKTLMAMGFRRRRILVSSFLVVVLAFVAAAVFLPKTYESEMRILIDRSRLDPAVSSAELEPAVQESVTVEEMNSEAELLKSHDLLRGTVLATGLQQHQWSLRSLLHWQRLPEDVKIERAIRWLSGRLTAEPLKKSNLIAVRFGSAYPELSVKVLNTLASLYFEKHFELRQSGIQVHLFEQQTERYRNQLKLAEAQLAAFPRQGGTVAGQTERDITVQKLREMKVELEETRARIEEARKRIASLQARLPQMASRITTQVRTADNPELIQQLQGTLLSLELKRTQLLQKFKPSYRLVRDVDEEIAQTQNAIAAAKISPLRDETTDRDPTYDWMRSELAKAQTDMQSLQGREISLMRSIRVLDEDTRRLHEAGIAEQDLLREIKALEGNYQLYSKKLEEARVGEALDRNRIFNIQLVQNPTLPVLPTRSTILLLSLGLFTGLMISIGAVFLSEYMDHTIHTPEDVSFHVGVPVLAALPKGQLQARDNSRARELGS
jgi:uncharacterized protein involved in exopolysaccharide biosynthesis